MSETNLAMYLFLFTIDALRDISIEQVERVLISRSASAHVHVQWFLTTKKLFVCEDTRPLGLPSSTVR